MLGCYWNIIYQYSTIFVITNFLPHDSLIRRQAALPPSVENPSYDRRPFAVLSPLQHNVLEHNIPELKAIHSGAHPTAMFYITTIIIMYLFGLIVILVHYMNSSYGKWTWTLSDVWDELQPSFCKQRYVFTVPQWFFSIYLQIVRIEFV